MLKNFTKFINFEQKRELRLIRKIKPSIYKEPQFDDKNPVFNYYFERKLKEYSKTHEKLAIDEIRKYSKYAKINKNRESKELLLLLEGKILVEEALKLNSVELKRIFCVRNRPELEESILNSGVPKELISNIDQQLMGLISDVKTNQGITAFVTYKKSQRHTEKNRINLSVLLDKVKDPGNMGTIIRTAAAIGCDRIFVTSESANPWSPKVLRSAMGAHFHIKILDRLKRDELNGLLASKRLVFADSKPEIKSIPFTSLHKKIASSDDVCLVVGNETKGISEQLYELNNTSSPIIARIPIEKSIESLNCSIAFAVIAFELQRILKKI